MVRKLKKTAAYILCSALMLSLCGFAGAAGDIYVNSSSEVLGTDIGSAYVVGGGGSVQVASDTYVITGSGTVKIGESGSTISGEYPEAPLGGTVAAKNNTVKIGLFYKTSSWDTTLASANLENEVGGGYEFGYYDADRVFHSSASTAETKLTMKPTGSGREVTVYNTDTGAAIYTHPDGAYNLAIHPISNSAKAVTWFKGYTYYGDFEYIRYLSDSLTVVNVVNVEDYVKGVIPYEMGDYWPVETLKAGAIAARNYVKFSFNKYATYGFDIVNNAYDQVYRGTSKANATTDAACDGTANQYMTYDGQICCAFYYAANGGASENSENVFLNPLGYCKAKQDPFEATIEFYCKSWSKTFTTAEISSKLSKYNLSTIASITPDYTEAGNIYRITMTDVNGKNAIITKSSCTTFLSRLGFSNTSLHFTIEYDAQTDTYTVAGGGAGHNVGLSQWGAYAMGQLGYNYRQILGFYYTDIAISQGV